MTTRALPDSLRLIRNYLRSVAVVTTYVAQRIYDEPPANPQFPAVLLYHTGGIPKWYGDDRARIDVNCYGRTRDEARALAAVVFKTLMEIPEVDQTHTEGTVSDIQPASDLQELDDPDYRGVSAPSRYQFSILATTHS